MAELESAGDRTERPQRIAVIAVHGVGDPGPSTTGRTLAKLLSNLNGRPTEKYAAFNEERITVPVGPLAGVQQEHIKSPQRSSFDDRGGYMRQRHRGANPFQGVPRDAGFTYDMVCGLSDQGPAASYETVRLCGQRKEGRGNSVDVYELYWADLVRVGTGAIRALSEVFQIMLHLPSVGQREMDMARVAQPGGRWKAYDLLQDSAVRILCLPLPILNLFLFALTLVSLPLRLPSGCHGIVAAIALILTLLVVSHVIAFRVAPRAPLIVWALMAAGAAVLGTLVALAAGCFGNTPLTRFGAENLLAVEWIAVASVGSAWIIRIYDSRRPGAASASAIAGIPLALAAVLCIARARNSPAAILTVVFQIADFLWILLALSWDALLILTILAALAGAWVIYASGRQDRTSVRRVAWTMRFTLALPTALFFVVNLTLWASILWVGNKVNLLPANVQYTPLGLLSYAIPASELNKVQDLSKSSVPAANKTEGGTTVPTSQPASVYSLRTHGQTLLVASGTIAFLAVLGLLLLAGAMAAWGLLPAVLRDILPPRRPIAAAVRLGAWLNRGYLLMRWAGEVVFFSTLLIVPLGIYGPRLLIAARKHDLGLPDPDNLLLSLGGFVGAAILSMFLSGRLDAVAKTIGPVLTAILDIDAYLRLHPRDDNPRGRIFTRYVGLLRHVCNAGRYDRIVIVSHSQGTVITADLFRFLLSFHDSCLTPLNLRQEPYVGAIPVQLITAGCPLRQLYALRFPNLYDWVITDSAHDGPPPAPPSIGMSEWTNFYRTGDYVGRWLWKSNDSALAPDVSDVGDGQDPWSPQLGPSPTSLAVNDRVEINLGAGGHVHYFDIHAPAVAYRIDELLS